MVMKEVNRRRMGHIEVQIGLGFKMKKRATDCEGLVKEDEKQFSQLMLLTVLEREWWVVGF